MCSFYRFEVHAISNWSSPLEKKTHITLEILLLINVLCILKCHIFHDFLKSSVNLEKHKLKWLNAFYLV